MCRFSRCLISWDPATRRARGGLPTSCKLGPPLETQGTKLGNGCSSDTLSQTITLFLIVKCRMKKKLFLDVDTGVDDAQAIMMALAAPDVEILGISCCHGNTSLDNALKNTLRVLKVCNRLDVSFGSKLVYHDFFFVATASAHVSRRVTYDTQQIPVYRGCAEPMIARKRHAGDFHGKDGLGDVPDPDPPSPELLKKKAVQALIKTVNENPGEVGG